MVDYFCSELSVRHEALFFVGYVQVEEGDGEDPHPSAAVWTDGASNDDVVWLFLTLLLGCKSTGYIYFPPIDKKFLINSCGYYGNSKLVYETYEKDKEFRFIGYYAIDNYGDQSQRRIKECSEYYSNGMLKARGSYQIGNYTQCCAVGPCDQYYNYKISEWNYYYPNNQLKAKCSYTTDIFHVKTSCQDGDSLKFNQIETIEAFDNLGNSIRPNVQLLTELTAILSER